MQSSLPLINGAAMAQNGLRHTKVPKVTWRNGALGSDGARVAHIDASHDDFRHLQPVAHKGRVKKDTLSLIARRDELYRELEEANSEVELSHGILAPFTAAWTDAHNELAGITERRRQGHTVPYAVLIGGYEARRIAGHERHPHKTRADDATKWRANIMKELQAVNAEIGA